MEPPDPTWGRADFVGDPERRLRRPSQTPAVAIEARFDAADRFGEGSWG